MFSTMVVCSFWVGGQFLFYLGFNVIFLGVLPTRWDHMGYSLDESEEWNWLGVIVASIVVAINLFFAVKECFF